MLLIIGGFFIMKKIGIGLLGVVTVLTLIGCHQLKNQMDTMVHPDHEKIEDVRELLNKVLVHIAENNPELSFEDGKLLDYKSGLPHFDMLPLLEIDHFHEEDVVDGLIVRPVVDVDNPRLLIIAKAVDKAASVNLNQAMVKVKSDQFESFENADMLTKYLIDNNQTVRQGNFLIYVTWEDAEEIVKVFERYVQ